MAIESYNDSIHRGIGMKPNEALLNQNKAKILEKQEIYLKEIEKSKHKKDTLTEGTKVLIRNEIKENKMDKEFKDCGVVKKKLDRDGYLVLKENGSLIKRNIIQLKPFLKEGS
ncbi:MAG: hypothetical protein ACRC0V_04365 [Fusobacteriaceae bacterium]